jgi:hypothetical protein
MSLLPLSPRLVHPLPPTPLFVGRDAELHELSNFWKHGGRGVLALVGLGGAGKTAVAARFLDHQSNLAPRPDGLFVWSFYQEPDAALCLQEAYQYFARPGGAVPAKGLGLLHLLHDALRSGGPHLLVLDGLERVQRQADSGNYGQLEDPLLKSLLTHIAEGAVPAAVLITSRFPLADLEALPGAGYRHIDVGGLDHPAAVALLRRRGVRGDDATLGELVDRYGAHALTLDHLGGLIGQFLGGDPNRAPELPAMTEAGADRQAKRLSRLLRAYEEHLPAAEMALLCKLCLLRRSIHEQQFLELFLCTPPLLYRNSDELQSLLLQFQGAEAFPAANWRQLVEAVEEVISSFVKEGPLAGPGDAFQIQVVKACADILAKSCDWQTFDLDALLRLYAGHTLDAPTDQRPLSADDRNHVARVGAIYRKCREHPLNTYKEKEWHSPLKLTFPKDSPKELPEDLGPSDVLRMLSRSKAMLRVLAAKHELLVRVRELCHFHQRKWALAGPLAPLSADELRQVIAALVDRRLVLREADGSFSVHPAVRDHFSRLAATQEQGSWHDLIREQLITLVRRPGSRPPEDRVTLDLVEEAIHHAVQAGRGTEAAQLYEQVLGGLRHLGWKLGEMARGLRILRSMQPCPDVWALAWYQRALGELEEAYEHNVLPNFRADVRLLQGRLPLVAAEGDDVRTAAARFLMGESCKLPSSLVACAVPRAHLLLYLDRLKDAKRATGLDEFYHTVGWEGDRARCQLLQAAVARRLGDADNCRSSLETASAWVLHSGSVEHLCLLHLIRARSAGDTGDSECAQRAVSAGLLLARQCGLGLLHIELLCEQAALMLNRADVPAAESAAGEALWRASAADCRFAWGEAAASHLLGQALILQRRPHDARAVLDRTVALRRRIGDPLVAETVRLRATVAE